MTTLEEFSALVAAIYDAALDPALWDQTLTRIFSAAGANGGGLLAFDPRRRSPAHMIAAKFDPEQWHTYDTYYGRMDPLVPVLEQVPAGAVVASRAITTEEQLRGEFYADWANRYGVSDAVFVNLLDDSAAHCTIVIGHPWDAEPFATPDLVRLVRLLAPHLQRALQAQLGFGPLRQIRDGALDLVDQWRHGCVLVSAAGKVLYANRAANGVAGSQDGLSLGCSGLHAAVAVEDAALHRLIHRACAGNGDGIRTGGRLAVSRGSGRRPYTLQVLPLKSNGASFLNGPAAALVIIVDHERETHLPPAGLRELYGLTAAEAEVALRILRGHGLQYAANELGVSLLTARTHLQRGFEKTGTHRQAELVRLLIELEASHVPGEADGAAEP